MRQRVLKPKQEQAPEQFGPPPEGEPSLDALPPHSHEAEQGVLGCILLDPKAALPECIMQFKAGADVFYDLRHRIIYTLTVRL